MTKKHYEVVGDTPYGDHQPGETFEADMDDEQEDRAIERGAIRVKRNSKKEDKDDG
jgi:hypothetical protein